MNFFFLGDIGGIIVELEVMGKKLFGYYVYLLLAWGCFRYWVRLPEVIEELWFKPVIWLVPLFWWRISLKGKPKLFNNKWFLSGFMGMAVGLFYFSLIRLLTPASWEGIGGANWSLNLIGIALTTAVVEEITFSGMVLGILDWIRGKKLFNLVVLGFMVVGVHLPINIFVFGLQGKELVGVLVWLFSVAVINGWLRRKTENVTGSIIARFILMLAVLG